MEHRDAGFKKRTRVSTVREKLKDVVTAHPRTEKIPVTASNGRVVGETVTSQRNVPNTRRAAMDGFAVRGEDTFNAGEDSPVMLRCREGSVGPGEAVKVQTGMTLPDGADTVLRVEEVELIEDEVAVFTPRPVGENVAPVGEDVEEGTELYKPGHQLRPSDIGLLKSVGRNYVVVLERPMVGVIPTGDELVQGAPAAGEVIETNGLMVSQYVRQWGGQATYRDVVIDDYDAIRAAIQRDLTKDIIVTTGGSSVGDQDFLPEVIGETGEIIVHGVGLRPGHPFGFGVVEDVPVIMLPGYPVSCIVNAVQFLRPAIKQLGSMPVKNFPSVSATLTEKIASEVGNRTFARVHVEERDDGFVATPVESHGAGVLSSVALADGWIEITESDEGIAAGESVCVQDWEWSA